MLLFLRETRKYKEKNIETASKCLTYLIKVTFLFCGNSKAKVLIQF